MGNHKAINKKPDLHSALEDLQPELPLLVILKSFSDELSPD